MNDVTGWGGGEIVTVIFGLGGNLGLWRIFDVGNSVSGCMIEFVEGVFGVISCE